MPEYFESELLFESVPDRRSHHASTLVELPDGELLCAWYAGTREGAPDVAILLSRRPAGERRWSPPVVAADEKDKSEGNPVLFCAPDGAVWLLFVTQEQPGWDNCSIKYKVSSDGGRTWTKEHILRGELGWMTRNKPVVLDNGDWLLPLYDEREWASLFGISSDGGRTWEFTDLLRSSPGNIQPSPIQRAGGSLLATMRTGGHPWRLWRSESTDRGRTWSAPELTDLPNPNSGTDMVRLSNGHVVLALNDAQQARTPLTLALSLDEGDTWPYKRHLESEAGEYSYPAVIQGRDGLIHVTYTYRRTHIKHAALSEDWIRAV